MVYALASDFASRPRKRTRRARRKLGLVPNKSSEKLLYFDFLPEEANENVMRYLSRAPGVEGWPGFVQKQDIATIYNAAGELGRFASSRFTCILVSEKNEDGNDDDDDVPAETETDEWIQIRDKNINIAVDALMRGGGAFKEIYVDTASAKQFLTSNMLDDISQNCPNIESLYLPSEGGRAWLERFADRLRTLKFTSGSPRKSIVAIQYCSNLRVLTLKDVNKCDVARTNIWAKIGETLQVLSIKFMYSGEEQIRNIEEHCRKLKHMDVCGLYNMAALSKCLASYENQLEYAAILANNMNTEQLRDVAKKCTRATFKLVFEEYVYEDYLRILGSQLIDVEIGRLNKRIDLSGAWNLCTNLEKIQVDAPTRLSDVQALVMTPKLSLKKITLDLHKKDGNVQSVMDAFATGGITTLETVWLSCFTPPSKAFDKFVDANKSLSSVSILINSRANNPLPISHAELREIAASFLKSASIKSLDVGDYYNHEEGSAKIESIAELCSAKARFRRIHVSLLGCDYICN